MEHRSKMVTPLAFFILTLFGYLNASSSRLMQELLKDYDKEKYPGDVTVVPEVVYRSCPTIDAEGIMSYSVKERYEWNDNRLRWNPENHENIRSVNIPLKSLWTPEIKLSVSSTVDDVDSLASNALDLTADVVWPGTVKVDRYSHYRTQCFVNSEAENVYDCTIKLGSMKTYTGEKTFKMVRSTCNTDMFEPMNDQCREIVVSRETNIETYSFNDDPTSFWFVVKLRLQRKSRYFVDF